MYIEVEDNPNCRGNGQFVFQELGAPRRIKAIRVTDGGREAICEVVAVGQEGIFGDAFSVKIADSGAGFAYLLHGGEWGIRLRPEDHAAEPWDLSNPRQWGEPFKIYGEEKDIIYE
jgi:hypothetical protein